MTIMKTNNDNEYELLSFDIELCYQIPEEDGIAFVREYTISDIESSHNIERDGNGIPMGQTMEEIKEREVLIKEFFTKWGNENPNHRVYNDALEDYIFIKGISVVEGKEHSAKSYRSTKAIMMIVEVLKNALPVRRIPTKKGNKNQSLFAYMLVMVYRHENIGTIKLTVGVKSNEQRIEYGISALPAGKPLIDDSKNSAVGKKKKRRSH